MDQTFQIIYDPGAFVKDKPKLSPDIKQRIRLTIEAKLSSSPHVFGEPLRFSLKGLWKLRVGDYRVIYKIAQRYVYIVCIGHRREIYARFKDE